MYGDSSPDILSLEEIKERRIDDVRRRLKEAEGKAAAARDMNSPRLTRKWENEVAQLKEQLVNWRKRNRPVFSSPSWRWDLTNGTRDPNELPDHAQDRIAPAMDLFAQRLAPLVSANPHIPFALDPHEPHQVQLRYCRNHWEVYVSWQVINGDGKPAAKALSVTVDAPIDPLTLPFIRKEWMNGGGPDAIEAAFDWFRNDGGLDA